MSQFESAPMIINPALAGLFEGSQRFNINTRSQWSSVTTPYSTFAAAFDMPLVVRTSNRDMIGFGLNVFRDVAGDSKFGTTQLNYSVSYIKAVDNSNTNFISLGIQNGIGQRSIDYAKLTFDNQFDGNMYDASIDSKEEHGISNFNYIDFGFGANWRYQPITKTILNIGISVMHLNKPMQSFLDDQSVRLDRKVTLYSYGLVPIAHDIDLQPKILYEKQGAFSELLLGASFKYTQRSKKNEYLAMNGGLTIRNKDAMIIQVGIDVLSMYMGLSYDINLSGLVPASNMRGGIEFALVYKLAKDKVARKKAMPCPIF